MDGRDQGFEDWFVTLRAGWHWDGYIAEHAHGFTTLREALTAANKAQPCDCEECAIELELKPLPPDELECIIKGEAAQ